MSMYYAEFRILDLVYHEHHIVFWFFFEICTIIFFPQTSHPPFLSNLLSVKSQVYILIILSVLVNSFSTNEIIYDVICVQRKLLNFTIKYQEMFSSLLIFQN